MALNILKKLKEEQEAPLLSGAQKSMGPVEQELMAQSVRGDRPAEPPAEEAQPNWDILGKLFADEAAATEPVEDPSAKLRETLKQRMRERGLIK